MKYLLVLALLFVAAPKVMAYDVSVHGYTKSNGTYVEPYHRSSPDSNPYNNYGYND